MQVFFESKSQKIKSEHRHDDKLEGQIVAIDCDQKKEVVRMDLYKKGQTYYCCLWITKDNYFFVTGSGKAKSRFGAVHSALNSAGISFDCELPFLDGHTDTKVWENLTPFVSAITEATGVKNHYVHNSLRCS